MNLKNKHYNVIAALIPYPAVIIGMYILHSAWLSIILYHLGILLFLRHNKISLKLPQTPKAYLGSLLLFPAIAVTYFMLPIITRQNVDLNIWLVKYGLDGVLWILFIPYFSIVHPILEEVHWQKNITTKNNLSVNHFIFAGYHILVLFTLIKPTWLILVFTILSLFSYLMKLTNQRLSLTVNVVIHGALDFAVVAAAHLLT